MSRVSVGEGVAARWLSTAVVAAAPLSTAVLAAAVLLGCSASVAAERIVKLRPDKTAVSFRLGATAHTVEGTLTMRAGEIRFDAATGAASGEIVIDLAGAKTGNTKRDKNMHQDVLETARFPQAVFHARKVAGTVAPAGRSDIEVEGVLTFHGADHPLTLPVTVTLSGERVIAETTFPIPFVAWGLHDPSFLFLRVEKVVTVRVRGEGDVRVAPAGGAGTAPGRF